MSDLRLDDTPDGAENFRFPDNVASPEAGTTFVRKPPSDLPNDHFAELPTNEGQLQQLKDDYWEKVKDLQDNDPRKVLFLRRFRPDTKQNLRSAFEYFGTDHEKLGELEKVKPYRVGLKIPANVKIGVTVGYHHLEKPWGQLFKKMFLDQVKFAPGSFEFLDIQNSSVMTGDRSTDSDSEINKFATNQGVTHLIDVHEELAGGNHYRNHIGFSEQHIERQLQFHEGRKNPNGGEMTFDPFIPLWCIEQYYEGYVYPQLQYAVNEQIRDIEILISNIQKE